jgi:hypothetical protein
MVSLRTARCGFPCGVDCDTYASRNSSLIVKAAYFPQRRCPKVQGYITCPVGHLRTAELNIYATSFRDLSPCGGYKDNGPREQPPFPATADERWEVPHYPPQSSICGAREAPP